MDHTLLMHIPLLIGVVTLVLTAPLRGEEAWRHLDRTMDAVWSENARVQASASLLLSWEQLLADALNAAVFADLDATHGLAQRAERLHFELIPLQTDHQHLWLLRDRGSGGRGLYVIRIGAAIPLVVMAPASRDARGTERCAMRTFWSSKARLVACDTGPDPSQGDDPDPLLTATARACARTMERLILLQYLGTDTVRTKLASRTAVLSGGSRTPDTGLETIGTRLDGHWAPVSTLYYPRDLVITGQLTDPRNQVMRRFPQHRFIICNLSPQLRTELLDGDPGLFDLQIVLGFGAP
jgi:hypothetical protein